MHKVEWGGDSHGLRPSWGRCWGEGDVLEPSQVLGVGRQQGWREFAAKGREDDRNPESLVNSALTGSIVCPGTCPFS